MNGIATRRTFSHRPSANLGRLACFSIAAVVAAATPSNAQVSGQQSSPHWTGLYFGGAVGLDAFNSNDVRTSTVLPVVGTQDAGSGTSLSLRAGYDHRILPRIVLGARISYNWSDAEHTDRLTSTGGAPTAASRSLPSSWELGGRLGYLATPDTLWFMTAGLAYAKSENSVGPTNGVDGSFSPSFSRLAVRYENHRLSGLYFGGGAETHLWHGFFLSAEYQVNKYDKQWGSPTPDPQRRMHFSEVFQQSARLGLNYKLGTDRNEPKVPSAPQIYRWTGLYLGMTIGAG